MDTQQPVRSSDSGLVHGRLLDLETQAPLTDYKVEVYDQDLVVDDLLGWCYVDSDGKFELRFDESSFKHRAALDIEGKPEVKLRILNLNGKKLDWVGILRAKEVDFRDIFVSATGKLCAPVLDPCTIAICPNCGTPYRSVSVMCADCHVPVRPLEGVES